MKSITSINNFLIFTRFIGPNASQLYETAKKILAPIIKILLEKKIWLKVYVLKRPYYYRVNNKNYIKNQMLDIKKKQKVNLLKVER